MASLSEASKEKLSQFFGNAAQGIIDALELSPLGGNLSDSFFNSDNGGTQSRYNKFGQ